MLRMACFSTSRIKLFVFIAALFLSAELRNNFLTQATRTSFTNTVLCIAMLIKDYCVFKNIVLLFDLSAVSEKESFVSSIFHQGLFFSVVLQVVSSQNLWFFTQLFEWFDTRQKLNQAVFLECLKLWSDTKSFNILP